MKHVGVVGCGLMGSGIAQVSAQAGFETTVVELNAEVLDRGMKRIDTFLRQAVRRGKMEEAAVAATKDRLHTGAALFALAECDLVIEAVTENVALKKEIFAQLDSLTPATSILASNTSSISITEIAAATDRADRVVGMHFFNPVPVMELVEIIRGLETSEATVAVALKFGEAVGKKPITCGDTPAFVVNKLLIPYLLDAIRMLEAGVATREDIDRGMTLGCAHPMGPITLLDYVGLDTTAHVADVMFEEYGDARFKAPVLLRRMVQAGHLGRKSGRGFYDYSS